MTRKRIILILIALSGLLVTGFEEDCAFHIGYRSGPGTAVAGAAGGTSTVGVTVTRPVPVAVESLHDVRANAPSRLQPAPGDRAIPFRKIWRQADTNVFAPRLSLSLDPAVSSLLAPALMAPAADNSFAGLDNPPPGPDVVPPDTMGAAGPSHLVSILNTDLGVFDKTGNILFQDTLDIFWSSLGLTVPYFFDPKILYDQHSGRFIAISLGGTSAPNSWLVLAVSSTSNPLDAWVKVAIDADKDNDIQQFNNSADYPGLGVDDTNIYINANMFNGSDIYQYSKVWVVPKAQLLSGPPGTLTRTEFRDPAGSDSSMQPAHTFGTPGEQYFVYEGGSGLLRFARVTFPGGTPTWSIMGFLVVDPFTTSSALQGMPQLGDSRTIDTSDTRLLNAVYRNGSLWTTHHVEGTGGKTEVAWYQINPSSMTVTMQGRISHASRWYAYPSIAVNQDGDVAIGFSGSSPSEYASSYYTMRKSGDASGTMRPVSLLKTGESSYYKILGGSENRWGDFSATCVDPTDNVSFWTLQEYAETPSAGRSMWGTWWGRFRPSTVNAPTGLTATAVSSTRIDLSWTDSSNETGYIVERRLTPGGDYSPIDNLAANITAYTDNSGIAAGSTYSYRVQAYNASGGSHSEEAVATTHAAPATGGGGGGGCAIGRKETGEDGISPLGTVLILLSPLGVLAWYRRSCAPPRGRPGVP